jgi:prolyl 4-hydroxylase
VNDFWVNNKGKETLEWKSINSYHNMWEAPPYLVSMEEKEFGGGPDLQRKVWSEARKVLEEWTGMRLSPVSMYGVRIYKNNSILAPHVDRMPLVTSCIINLEQDVDEIWPLEVFDHQGNAHNITMEPGDMVRTVRNHRNWDGLTYMDFVIQFQSNPTNELQSASHVVFLF